MYLTGVDSKPLFSTEQAEAFAAEWSVINHQGVHQGVRVLETLEINGATKLRAMAREMLNGEIAKDCSTGAGTPYRAAR